MKTVKKIISVFVVLAMLLAMAACAGENVDINNGTSGTDKEGDTVVTTGSSDNDPSDEDPDADGKGGDEDPGKDDETGDGDPTETGDDEHPAGYVDEEFAGALAKAIVSIYGGDIVRTVDLEYTNLLSALSGTDLTDVKTVKSNMVVKTDADAQDGLEMTVVNDDGTEYSFVVADGRVYRAFTYDGVTDKEYTVMDTGTETADPDSDPGLGLEIGSLDISEEMIVFLLTGMDIDFSQAFGTMEVQKNDDGSAVITIGEINSGLINSYAAMIIPEMLQSLLDASASSETDSNASEIADLLLTYISDDSVVYDLSFRIYTDGEGAATKLEFTFAASVQVSLGAFTAAVEVISLNGNTEYTRTDVTVTAPEDADDYTEIPYDQFMEDTLAVLTGSYTIDAE